MSATRWLSDEEQEMWRRGCVMEENLSARLSQQLIKSSGLSIADYHVLVPLSENSSGKMRSRDIARELGWDRSRVSHQVSRMERRGLLEKEACLGDARGMFVSLTSKGRQAIEEAAPSHVKAVRKYCIDLLSAEEIRTLSAVFQRILTALRQDNEPESSSITAVYPAEQLPGKLSATTQEE